MKRAVVVHPTPDVLARATAARLALAVLDAQSVREEVHVVLTGGGMGTRVVAELGRSPLLEAIDVSALHLWWGDERFAPTGDADRNDTLALEALAQAGIPGGNVHVVAGPDRVASPEAAAEAYAAELARYAPQPSDGAVRVPRFDVLLLGVGPDGHVASLFPGHEALGATGATVGVHGSPKPPPLRVSLTFAALEAARRVWFVAAGEEKASAIARGLEGDESLPLARVHGSAETLWLLDVAAAPSPTM